MTINKPTYVLNKLAALLGACQVWMEQHTSAANDDYQNTNATMAYQIDPGPCIHDDLALLQPMISCSAASTQRLQYCNDALFVS